MPLSLKSIIQQAMLAASPALVVLPGCGDSATHVIRVVPRTFPDGGGVPSSLSHDDCVALCQINFPGCGGAADAQGCSDQGPTADGGEQIDCAYPQGANLMCTGRRPDGLCVPGRTAARSVAGDFFARSAHLEAASVVAFRRLGQELQVLGAPARLVASAERARRDELRHTRAMRRLSARFGGRVPRVQVPRCAPRTLEAVAVENAVEGCVRETYGAAVGAFQARSAHDARVRAAMARIAVDEAAHAQLAWELHAWALPRLTAPARRRIAALQRQAVAELREEVAPDPLLRCVAGLPDPRVASRLHAALSRQLWRLA